MTFCELVGVIVIRVLSALLDDDWPAAALHVDWQAVARAPATTSNNAFCIACFMFFLSKPWTPLNRLDPFGSSGYSYLDLRVP